MIEFIVLGIVPGTSAEISFSHIATLMWLSFIGYYIVKQARQSRDS